MKAMALLDFPEGELGEIVALEDAGLVEHFGIHIGMSVVVLQKAVEWLVQIGCNQVHINKDQLQKIHVKPASL